MDNLWRLSGLQKKRVSQKIKLENLTSSWGLNNFQYSIAGNSVGGLGMFLFFSYEFLGIFLENNSQARTVFSRILWYHYFVLLFMKACLPVVFQDVMLSKIDLSQISFQPVGCRMHNMTDFNSIKIKDKTAKCMND